MVEDAGDTRDDVSIRSRISIWRDIRDSVTSLGPETSTLTERTLSLSLGIIQSTGQSTTSGGHPSLGKREDLKTNAGKLTAGSPVRS